MPRMPRVFTVLVLLAAVQLGACASVKSAGKKVVSPGSWHLPWHRKVVAPPVAVSELGIESDGGSAAGVLQFWNRNNLRVDLTGIAGSGVLRLTPSAVNGWPVRLEFAVRPGSFAQLEVRGDQRAVFNIAATGDGAPEILPLSPDVYSSATKVITLTWAGARAP